MNPRLVRMIMDSGFLRNQAGISRDSGVPSRLSVIQDERGAIQLKKFGIFWDKKITWIFT